jgi:prepilin-type N-terminal cleavage/methylation domain-containing protein
MRQQTFKNKLGFTLTELAVVIAIASIVMLSMGTVLVDTQRGWNQMFNRVNNGVVNDGYAARKAFDAVVRKSSKIREELGDGEVVLYYYNDPASSTRLDRYARFYAADTELLVVYGKLDSEWNQYEQTSPITLADNVEAVSFYVNGACVQMVLRLDNGSESLIVLTSAIRHNE